MSWISDLTGIHLGNVGAPIGAAIGSIIPGVGTAIGAGLGQAIGSVGSGHSVGTALGQGALAGGLGALSSIPGVSDVVKGIGGDIEGAVSKIPGGQAILDAVKSGGAGIGDLANFIMQHKDGLIQAAGVAQSAMNQAKANSYAGQALKQAQDAYTAKAPLRQAGIQGMQYSATHGNPFAAGFSPIPVAPSAPAPSAAPAMPLLPVGSGPSQAPPTHAAAFPAPVSASQRPFPIGQRSPLYPVARSMA